MRAPRAVAWMDDAACAAPPTTGLPWLDATHTLPPVLVDLMADVCARCPVLVSCASYVTKAGVTGGFWAGADRDPTAALVQLDLLDLLEHDLLRERDDLGGAA